MEVDCQRASLRSRASLVLLNAEEGLLYLWHGCKAHVGTREVAKRAADKITERYTHQEDINGYTVNERTSV